MTALDRLQQAFRLLGRTLLGYSGGVDSAVLAVCGVRTLGPVDFLAVIGRSPSYPAAQYEGALSTARAYGVPLLEVDTDELGDPAYRANGSDRCFHCKRELWERLGRISRERDFSTIIDGTNADDLGEHRPGVVAGLRAGIRSPLAELKFSKAQVRQMAKELGLPIWDAPAAPCLASRIAYGLPVTVDRLRQVEVAEAALRALGLTGNLRVRHRGAQATVEVDPEWIDWLADRWEGIEPLLVTLGFEQASVDPRGYRRGALVAELPVLNI